MIKLISNDKIEVHLCGHHNVSTHHYVLLVLILMTIVNLIVFSQFGFGRLFYGTLALMLPLLIWFLVSKQKTSDHIHSGKLTVTSGKLLHHQIGVQYNIVDCQTKQGKSVSLLLSCDNGKYLTISGFEQEKEAEVVTSFLQGKAVSVRKKTIKMKNYS